MLFYFTYIIEVIIFKVNYNLLYISILNKTKLCFMFKMCIFNMIYS